MALPRILGGAALALLAAACGGGGVIVAPAPERPAIDAFTASPATTHPGEGTSLVPVFRGGAGRIEPGVGPVESGRAYPVGPHAAARTFTLVVTPASDPARELRRDLVVPLEYWHRLAPRPASPAARTGHGAAVVGGGRVLVVGGSSTGGTGWDTADLVDPATGEHVPAGDLWTARSHVPVVALADGGALAVGGDTDVNDLRSVERWEPATRTFTRLSDLLEKRASHTATTLASGLVLVAGSDAFLGSPAVSHRGAELYDPTGVGTSRIPAGGDMIQARFGHTATLLPDGRVLLVGGWDAYSGAVALSAEVFDPATETFALAGTLGSPRAGHAAVLLADGRVLVVGGGDLEPAAAAEAWTPPGGFAPAGVLAVPRWDHQAVRLGSGEVLVLGGADVDGHALASVETWRPGDAAFTLREGVLTGGRRGMVVAPLPDGRVMVHGGEPGNGFPVVDVGVYE